MGESQRDEGLTGRAPSGQSQNNLSNKVNRRVLDYSPKDKVSIYEYMPYCYK